MFSGEISSVDKDRYAAPLFSQTPHNEAISFVRKTPQSYGTLKNLWPSKDIESANSRPIQTALLSGWIRARIPNAASICNHALYFLQSARILVISIVKAPVLTSPNVATIILASFLTLLRCNS